MCIYVVTFCKNMDEKIYLDLNRDEFYKWLSENHNSVKECFVKVIMKDPKLTYGQLSYLDAVEVALCFGWIDSTTKKINNFIYQRFSPRLKKSHWTELNKERVRRLIKLGEMTKYGLSVCPNLDIPYLEPKEIINELKKDKKAYEFFKTTPLLYQRIRLSNIEWTYKRTKNIEKYKKSIENLIKYCWQGNLYGKWDDYGRLIQY